MDNKYQPAFPVFLQEGLSHNSHVDAGLNKREYFAAMAMQGLCANSIPGKHHEFKHQAMEAVRYADALIKELNTPIKAEE
jgi:hypothetical protein